MADEFKPRKRRGANRAAGASSLQLDQASAGSGVQTGEDSVAPQVVHVTKKQRTGALIASTASSRRKAEVHRFSSSGDTAPAVDPRNLATSVAEIDTAPDRDEKALFEAARDAAPDTGSVAADGAKVYRGARAYEPKIEKRDDSYGIGAGVRAGPQRGAQHVRTSIRIDYQPDICKDYKDTGYCGYGDNCKFMHDRTEYKSSEQLDREWREAQENPEVQDAEPELEDVPHSCHVCRRSFIEPVVTPCGHYFCEACVMRETLCPICRKPTMGTFNAAAKELARKRADRQAKLDARSARKTGLLADDMQ